MADLPKVNTGESLVGVASSFTERALSTPSQAARLTMDDTELAADIISRAGIFAFKGLGELCEGLDHRLDDDFTLEIFGEPVTLSQMLVRLSVYEVCTEVAAVIRSNSQN